MTLNPNTPTLVGSEWLPSRQRGLAIDPNRAQAALFTPGAVTGDDIAVYLKNVVGSPVINAELIKVSDINAGAAVTTTDTFRPSADLSVTNARHGATASTTPPFYSDIDETVLDVTDWLDNTSTSGSWYFNMATGAFPTGRRVAAVRLHMVVQAVAAGQYLNNPGLKIGGTVYYNTLRAVPTSQTTIEDLVWTTNPATQQPWTVADIQAFATTSGAGFDLLATGSVELKLFQMWITVDWVTETRLAFGSATPAADGWLTIPMATPAGVTTWTPTAATQYALVLSTATPSSVCAWAGLDSGVAHPDYSSSPVTRTNGYPISLGALDTAALALVVTNGTPAYGQPYALIYEEEVNLNRTHRQEVTLPDAQSRGWVRFAGRQAANTTSAPLVARLKRTSDNVQIGGDVTVNPFDVRLEPRLPQAIPMAAASGAAASAVQHYVEFSSVASVGAGWLLTTISTENDTYASIGIGGTTDQATIAGTRTQARDVPLVVGVTRTAPAGPTVVLL